MNQDSAGVVVTKVTTVWTLAVYGIAEFPIGKVVLWATLAYTLLQIYLGVRKVLRERREEAAASKAFAEKITAPEAE